MSDGESDTPESETIGRAIGAAIAEARRAKGWTAAELARRSGISPQHVTHAERGTRARGVPSVLTLLRLARVLGGIAVRLPGATLTVRGDPPPLSQDGRQQYT